VWTASVGDCPEDPRGARFSRIYPGRRELIDHVFYFSQAGSLPSVTGTPSVACSTSARICLNIDWEFLRCVQGSVVLTRLDQWPSIRPRVCNVLRLTASAAESFERFLGCFQTR
jgi:hypothetical protein